MKKDHYKFSAIYTSGKRSACKVPKSTNLSLRDLEEYLEECLGYMSFSQTPETSAYKVS